MLFYCLSTVEERHSLLSYSQNNLYTSLKYIHTYNICLLMYMHMCANTLSPAQPSPYISPRLYICVSIQQESHHLAVAVLSRYDDRSMPNLFETKRRKRISYHPRSHQISFLKRQLLIYKYLHTYIHTYKPTLYEHPQTLQSVTSSCAVIVNTKSLFYFLTSYTNNSYVITYTYSIYIIQTHIHTYIHCMHVHVCRRHLLH